MTSLCAVIVWHMFHTHCAACVESIWVEMLLNMKRLANGTKQTEAAAIVNKC